MPVPSISTAALLGLLALVSSASAFLLPQPAPPKPATTTRLAAHSHLQAALHLMQQQGPGSSGSSGKLVIKRSCPGRPLHIPHGPYMYIHTTRARTQTPARPHRPR